MRSSQWTPNLDLICFASRTRCSWTSKRMGLLNRAIRVLSGNNQPLIDTVCSHCSIVSSPPELYSYIMSEFLQIWKDWLNGFSWHRKMDCGPACRFFFFFFYFFSFLSRGTSDVRREESVGAASRRVLLDGFQGDPFACKGPKICARVG